MKPLLIAGMTVLALAGCRTETAMKPDPDTCGASAYANLIGTPHADHDFTQPDRDLRIITPGSAVTMDYRAERLNVDVDKTGAITRFWCG